MIIDNIKNCNFYYGLGENFAKAFEYLKTNDMNSIPCGKYEIDGENVYAIVQEYSSKSIEDGKWEAHQKYIDIQYIISGQEEMGYSDISEMKISEKYDEAKDILFLKGSGDFFVINSGNFVMFTPNDAHMPGIAVLDEEHVKKVVIKIAI